MKERAGEPLPNIEQQKSALSERVDGVIKAVGAECLKAMVAGKLELPREPLGQGFLRVFLAARLCLDPDKRQTLTKGKLSFVKMDEANGVLKKLDPEIFKRCKDVMAFIRAQTSISSDPEKPPRQVWPKDVVRKSSLLGRPQTKEHVDRRSPVWIKVRPFYARGGSNREISEITGISQVVVTNVARRAKHKPQSTKVLPFAISSVDSKESGNRFSRAQRLRAAREKGMSQDEENDIKFARALLKRGLITGDMSFWTKLDELYKANKRPLPESFAQQLRLEFFLTARVQAVKGDKGLLNRYIKMGEEIGGDWFGRSLIDEQRFITQQISSSSDRKNGQGVGTEGEDRFVRAEGFFRAAGRAWRD